MFNESFWILICFTSVVMLSFKFLRKKVDVFLENKINSIVSEMDLYQSQYKSFSTKIESLHDEVRKTEEDFKALKASVESEIENLKKQKFSESQNNIQLKQEQLKQELSQAANTTRSEIANEIIDSSKLLVIEFLKRDKVRKDDDLKSLESLVKNLKIN